MSDENCPHCGHVWVYHLHGSCLDCGCKWPRPVPPPPPPPTERDLLIGRVEDVIWSALEAQDIYVDRAMDMVDASGSGLDMTAVAAAVVTHFDFGTT